MDTNVYLASKKRLLLSWYIDFLFFMTLWDLFSYFIILDKNFPSWPPYMIFISIRMLSEKHVGSIGYLLLGINKETKTVNSEIFERESWLTILLGVLFISEGTKQLVRWTQMLVPQPIFGFFPDDLTQIAIHVALGTSSILAGYWFLKLNIKGFYLAASVAVINIVSDTLSWNLWGPVIEKMVIARRELQGMPVREGEIKFMHALFPEGMIAMTGFAIIAMLFTYKIFYNANSQS